jgi:aldose 1-epimerase
MDALTYSSAALEVVVLPGVGARLHRLRAFGQDLLRTPERAAVHAMDPFHWGAYVMAPWCNRLEAGRTRLGSRWLDLPSNFPDGSAIHGQVYARPWQVQKDGRLTIRGGGDAWPWRYEVAQRLTASGAELRIELKLTNLDDEPMPAGLGIHPWFRRPLRVAIHGGRVFPNNLESEARSHPVGGTFDLRVLGEMASDTDATWTNLDDPAVELVWPQRARGLMRMKPSNMFIVAASPSAMDAIAVEPQTHVPYGLRRLLAGEPGGLTLLAPHETLSLVALLGFEQLAK